MTTTAGLHRSAGERRGRLGVFLLTVLGGLAWFPAPRAGAQDRAPRPSDAGAAEVVERSSRLHEHAVLSRECARFCRRMLGAWAERAEPSTGLLPERHNNPVWTPENSAADLFSWLVLAADWAGDEDDRRRMRQVLETEIALTTRFQSLPDAVHLDDLAFYHAQPRRERLVVGASEYARDGLLPIVEALGSSVWSDRLTRIATDLATTDGMPTRFGRMPAYDAEVNGELLQTLTRMWHFTGDDSLVPMVETVVRAYIDGVASVTGLLPCQRFDFRAGRVVDGSLRLHDHGNEILGGLVEAALLVRRTNPELHAQLQSYLHEVFGVLAERAVKADGTLVARLDAATGEVLDERTTDTTFYVLLAFLAWSEIGGGVDYRPLVARALAALVGGTYDEWPTPDDYADTIEVALLLMRRMPSPEAEDFVRRSTRRLLAFQRPDGSVYGGYGDGNVARTARLTGRWLRGGTSLEPHRDDLLIGAVIEGDVLHAVLAAETPYSGFWQLDHPRHRRWMRLPLDLPRLNEDPEWFPVEGDHWYALAIDDLPARMVLGATLREGWPVELVPGKATRLRVERLGPTPTGGHRIRVDGPTAVAPGFDSVRLELSHALPFAVRLGSDPPLTEGTIDVPPGETVAVTVPLGDPRLAQRDIATFSVTFADEGGVLFGRWRGHQIVGDDALDVRLLRGDDWATDLTWIHVGRRGFDIELDAPEEIEPGTPLDVRFLLARRPAALRVRFANGPWHEVAVGADEHPWVTAPVPTDRPAGPIRVRVAPLVDGTPLRLAAIALCRPPDE